MIRLPQRSVTRFFIPLIDVLLLLFCVFLLMPLANEDDLKRSQDSTQNLTEDVDALEREIQQLREQLARYRLLEPKLLELDQLLAKIDRLEKAAKKNLQERIALQIVDVDGKNGAISFHDSARAENPRIALDGEEAVRALIERHKNENPGRELYYVFLYPRPDTGFPTLGQEKTYQRWFRSVAHSLKETSP